MRYFESDDYFEEVAAASLHVAAATCLLSAVSGSARIPDGTVPKCETSQTPELKSKIQSSCYFWKKSKYGFLLILINWLWLPLLSTPVQRENIQCSDQPCRRINLTFGTEPVTCRLLFNGHRKYVNSHHANYQKQLRNGKKPKSLNAKYTKTDQKQKVCDDINFLSRSSKFSHTTLKNFERSPNVEVTTGSKMKPAVTRQQVSNQGPKVASTE